MSTPTQTTGPLAQYWSADGKVIRHTAEVVNGVRYPKDDAAKATLIGGPADGTTYVRLAAPVPPAYVAVRIKELSGQLAWYERMDRVSKLTYRYAPWMS